MAEKLTSIRNLPSWLQGPHIVFHPRDILDYIRCMSRRRKAFGSEPMDLICKVDVCLVLSLGCGQIVVSPFFACHHVALV